MSVLSAEKRAGVKESLLNWVINSDATELPIE